MRELSLFSGTGMGVYGTGLRTIAYCEANEYRRRVLRSRMEDKSLSYASIWPDVKQLSGHMYIGKADIVTGGFPCQAFSQAAHGNNTSEDLWPEMLRIVDECRAQHVFAENVQRAPIERAASDLHARGYTCRLARVDAAPFGAPHRRERWWIVAHADEGSKPVCPVHAQAPGVQALAGTDEWATPPPARVDDGCADWMERHQALGDGQVPAVARYALSYLW